MPINNTSEFFEELTKAALSDEGWEVESVKYSVEDSVVDYIRAVNPDDDKSYLICTVGRCLSNKKSQETPMILAEVHQVDKLKEVLDQDTCCSIPCISYGIAKYSMLDFEIAIVPLCAIEANQKTGGVYATTENGYYYNYTKIQENEKPVGCIFRKLWKAQQM